MAGHSKFKNIMHRKGAQDAKRAKIFTKIGREITVAVRISGADVNFNPRLRSAVIAARGANMPNDRIKRAIDAGLGAGDAAAFTEMRYEGYGPGGIAIIVEALTDNKNRTAADVRSAFSKYDGAMGETNSVSFMFERIGEIAYPLSAGSADAIFEAAVEAGANDCETDEEEHYISVAPENLAAVRDVLVEKLGDPLRAELIWWPLNRTEITDEDTAKTLMKLIDALEDNDDVQTVTTNMDVADDLMAKLAA
jgi:YebC/PmpR family DNA-binding regulatory protein